MSSQVDGHDEERELRSFGYEQQLSRSMGVFSSLSISISCMCITAGIFTVYAYALSTAGPALLAGGAYPFAELLTHTCPLERVAEPLAQAAGLTDPDDRLLKAVIRP